MLSPWRAAPAPARQRSASAKLSADSEGASATTTFSPDQAFYAIVELANAPSDTKLKAVWTAVEVEGEQPDLLIDQTEISAENENVFTFNLTNNGLWPVGKYKVDIYLNNTLDQTLEFQVQSRGLVNPLCTIFPQQLGFWSSLAGVLLCLVYLLALLGNYQATSSLQLIEPYQALISVVLLLSCPLLVFVFAALHGAIQGGRGTLSLLGLSLVIASRRSAALIATSR